MPASASRRLAMADALRGRKPSKKKCSIGRPEATRAQVTAEGPGMTSTLRPRSRAASTSLWPGSDTPGMPASDTKATRPPASIRAMAGATLSARTFSSARCKGTRMPKCASSLDVTRVSSHRSRSAARSVSSARGVTSRRLPMGVPTTERTPPRGPPVCVPAISQASCARRRQARRGRPSPAGGPRSSMSERTRRDRIGRHRSARTRRRVRALCDPRAS